MILQDGNGYGNGSGSGNGKHTRDADGFEDIPPPQR